jgi:shikimate kinase
MPPSLSIFLIGPMGAGKSAVGRKLAEELQLEFVDSDEFIEERTGVDIPYIFEREGESGFRARERQAIEELTQLSGVVLATGGGAVQDPMNREHLGERGRVVYLHASIDQQLKRTRSGRERPMLKNGDPRDILESLMAIREPQYRQIADITVETDGRRVTAVTREIRRRLQDLATSSDVSADPAT